MDVGLCIVIGQGYYFWLMINRVLYFHNQTLGKIYSGQFLKRGTKGKGQPFEILEITGQGEILAIQGCNCSRRWEVIFHRIAE